MAPPFEGIEILKREEFIQASVYRNERRRLELKDVFGCSINSDRMFEYIFFPFLFFSNKITAVILIRSDLVILCLTECFQRSRNCNIFYARYLSFQLQNSIKNNNSFFVFLIVKS